MQSTFTKLEGNRYVARIERPDGVVFDLVGYDRKWTVPHDLAHLIAERNFNLDRGFWGSVAAGAQFKSMSLAPGPRARPRHDAARRSADLLKKNHDELILAEVVAGVVHHAVEDPLDLRQARADLEQAWGTLRPGPCPYGRATLQIAIAELTAARDRWQTLDVGGGLVAAW